MAILLNQNLLSSKGDKTMNTLTAAEQSMSPVNSQEDENQYLTFLLDGEMFTIGILNIKEIIEYGQLTEVPLMPGFMRGVINLRGRVVPVIDLSVRFGRQRTDITKRTCIVIVEIRSEGIHQDIGLLVDAVSEVLDIPHEEIEPSPSFGANIRTEFISGMGKINGKFVIILNIEKVLSVDELAIMTMSTEEGSNSD